MFSFAQSMTGPCLHIICGVEGERSRKKAGLTSEVTPDGHPVARSRRKSDVLPPEAEHSRKSLH